MTSINYSSKLPSATLIVLTLMIVACTDRPAFSWGLKKDGMTDADYIKINVRWGYSSIMTGVEGLPVGRVDLNQMGKVLKSSVDIRDELCNKYGYTESALANKYDEVHSRRDAFWTLQNIEVLRVSAMGPEFARRFGLPPMPGGNRVAIENTDEAWDKFFIDNEARLRPPEKGN